MALGLLLIMLFVSCATIYDGETPKRDFKTAAQRLKAHPLPEIYIVYNDYQVGWLYNKGNRFSDSEFNVYVRGLAIMEICKEVKFFFGINRHGKKVIRYAVIYF